MFNFLKKKEPKANWLAINNASELKDYYEEHKDEFAEFDAALKPLSDEQSKAKIIIQQIYAQHNIDTGKSWFILPEYLDNEVFTDLCVFNDAELASLRKWTQRYKELETEMIDLGKKYRNVAQRRMFKYLEGRNND